MFCGAYRSCSNIVVKALIRSSATRNIKTYSPALINVLSSQTNIGIHSNAKVNWLCKNQVCYNSSVGDASNIVVVGYDEVKNLPKHPEKLLIDVRDPLELQETGKIPTSINIPVDNVSQELAPGADALQFKKRFGRDKPTASTELIFHCKIGKRSLRAAEAAVALGYKNVKNYVGSWDDWSKREGLP